MKSLVSNSIYAKKDGNDPVPNKLFLQLSPNMAMLFAPFRCTHPPPPIPPFLLKQNLSPTDIGGSENFASIRLQLPDISRLVFIVTACISYS